MDLKKLNDETAEFIANLKPSEPVETIRKKRKEMVSRLDEILAENASLKAENARLKKKLKSK